jgi:putative oxidoreductase
MNTIQRLNAPSGGSAIILIRLLVGWVFLSEGIGKFLYAAAQGAGRFEKIGIPAPQVMGPFVGVVEIICGSLILLGLVTRLAAIPLLINISVAILATKVPILLGTGYWRFSLPNLSQYGLWSMLHEARTDFSMALGLIFLLVVGGGRWSLDAVLFGTPPHAAGRNDQVQE